MIDTDVREMLSRSLGGEPEFDAERYVTAACQARRRRRRHRAYTGTALLGAAVLASAVVAWPAGHRARDHVVSTATPTPSPSPTGIVLTGPPPLTDADAARLSAVIRQHFPMPAGTHAVRSKWDAVQPLAVRARQDATATTAGEPYYWGEFDLVGPGGTGSLTISIGAVHVWDRNGSCQPYFAACWRRLDGDGSIVEFYQEPPDGDFNEWGVDVLRSDGTAVYFGLANWGRNQQPELKAVPPHPGRTGQPVPTDDLVTLAKQPDLHL